MNRDQIVVSWKQLKDKIVFQWGRPANDNGKRVELIGAEMSWDGQSREAEMRAFRPDDRRNQSEFSQHISC